MIKMKEIDPITMTIFRTIRKVLETWVLNTELFNAFLTKEVSEIRTRLSDSLLAKRLLFLEILPRANVMSLFFRL